ncbi:MAG: hypothetical protein KKF00_04870, partial [Proteobacteria bacterium]|nr:hypothetical protein [Pseudomonadota bacterium]
PPTIVEFFGVLAGKRSNHNLTIYSIMFYVKRKSDPLTQLYDDLLSAEADFRPAGNILSILLILSKNLTPAFYA